MSTSKSSVTFADAFKAGTRERRKEEFPEAEDFIGAFRILIVVICGIAAGILGLEGIIPLVAIWAIASVVGFLYSKLFLMMDATAEDGITFVSIIGNNFFPVLSSLLLSWTISYNLSKNPAWIGFEIVPEVAAAVEASVEALLGGKPVEESFPSEL